MDTRTLEFALTAEALARRALASSHIFAVDTFFSDVFISVAIYRCDEKYATYDFWSDEPDEAEMTLQRFRKKLNQIKKEKNDGERKKSDEGIS